MIGDKFIVLQKKAYANLALDLHIQNLELLLIN